MVFKDLRVLNWRSSPREKKRFVATPAGVQRQHRSNEILIKQPRFHPHSTEVNQMKNILSTLQN